MSSYIITPGVKEIIYIKETVQLYFLLLINVPATEPNVFRKIICLSGTVLSFVLPNVSLSSINYNFCDFLKEASE